MKRIRLGIYVATILNALSVIFFMDDIGFKMFKEFNFFFAFLLIFASGMCILTLVFSKKIVLNRLVGSFLAGLYMAEGTAQMLHFIFDTPTVAVYTAVVAIYCVFMAYLLLTIGAYDL
jgi:hypothetical protein